MTSSTPSQTGKHSEPPPLRSLEEVRSHALRLSGKPWHSLSREETGLAIELQHVWKVLSPAARDPDNLPGICLVGTPTQYLDS